jgi:hypothetical protein
MITLRIPPHLLAPLHDAFDGAAEAVEDFEHPPVDLEDVARVRAAFAEAKAAALPGLPVIIELQSGAELFTLQACWEVGGEGAPGVTDDAWDEINALIEAAAQSAD